MTTGIRSVTRTRKLYDFDIFTAAKMANEKARVEITGISRHYVVRWRWQHHDHHITFDRDASPEQILQRLFQATLAMATLDQSTPAHD